MKVDVTEDGRISLKEVFETIIMETSEGNKFIVCMRDNGLEIGVPDTSIKHNGPGTYYN